VDPALAQFAADCSWLSGQGVGVERYNLAQQPQAYAENETMPAGLASLPRIDVPLLPFAPMGVSQLRAILNGHGQKSEAPWSGERKAVPKAPMLVELIDAVEKGGSGVILTMGKGGVGKTTVAAAIAIELAHRGHKVHLSTTDPAAHLAATVIPYLQQTSNFNCV
jgi:arsenite-transporting ATPase